MDDSLFMSRFERAGDLLRDGQRFVARVAPDGRMSAPVTRDTSVMESNGKSMAAWAFRIASSSGPDMKQNVLPAGRFT